MRNRLCSFRPLNSIEKRENSKVVVSFDDNLKTVGLVGENATLAGAEKARARLESCLLRLPAARELTCGLLCRALPGWFHV